MDSLTSMRVFVRAASDGSLSAAARHFSMSPAMASKHVNALESRLGVKLFHRTTRRLALTEAGSHYLEACQRILPDIDEADANAASQRLEATGVLRFSLPLSFGNHCIVPLLPEFSRRHPRVHVELGLNDGPTDLIEGRWDLGLRVGRLADSPLRYRSLGNCSMLLCAAPDYLQRYGTPTRTSELRAHNCLGYTLSAFGGSREWPFGPAGEVRVAVRGNLAANNGEALLVAAEAGQGLIYQPDFIVAKALREGRLRSLELELPNYSLGGIHLLYPPERQPPAKVRVMIDYLLEAFHAPSGTGYDEPPVG